MDWLISFLQLATGVTFLILACGGPYAIIQLRRFIRHYATAHKELGDRIAALEDTYKEHGDPL